MMTTFEIPVHDAFDHGINPRGLTTALDKLTTEPADTIVLASKSQWGAVPYPKVGFGHPRPIDHTVWKKERAGNRLNVRGPSTLKFSAFKRPIFMVDSLAALNRFKITSDVHRLNIVVMKPFPTR